MQKVDGHLKQNQNPKNLVFKWENYPINFMSGHMGSSIKGFNQIWLERN
jgi:hypothetical protein